MSRKLWVVYEKYTAKIIKYTEIAQKINGHFGEKRTSVKVTPENKAEDGTLQCVKIYKKIKAVFLTRHSDNKFWN